MLNQLSKFWVKKNYLNKMGIKIEKPSIYLGSTKLNLHSIAPKYKNVISEK